MCRFIGLRCQEQGSSLPYVDSGHWLFTAGATIFILPADTSWLIRTAGVHVVPRPTEKRAKMKAAEVKMAANRVAAAGTVRLVAVALLPIGKRENATAVEPLLPVTKVGWCDPPGLIGVCRRGEPSSVVGGNRD